MRIALGGPEDNPWTARLLADCGPAVTAEVAGRLAAGAPRRAVAARPAVPRGRVPPRRRRARAAGPAGAAAWPGPDLAAAAGAVTADLADSVIEVTPVTSAGEDPDPPLAAHTVALLNRGTPSSLVSPDGTLHIALMRSCSAWPSGVWIDGDKQLAPDGSSFAWQHWSHTFEYALAAGPGDWRSAGLARAGQEFNRDLVACGTGLHDGPLPGSASLGSVSGPGMLTALKPRGNPLAAGRAGTPDRAAGLTARLRDLGGRSASPGRAAAAGRHRGRARHRAGRGAAPGRHGRGQCRAGARPAG